MKKSFFRSLNIGIFCFIFFWTLGYGSSVDELEQKCNANNAKSCIELGSLYENGKGVKQDYLKAKELYEKACDSGEALGCAVLGVLYETGKGVRQDYFKAKEFYGKACDLGLQEGCDGYRQLNEKGY